MTGSAWDRVKELFDEWESLDGAGRAAFRRRLESEDEDVREELEGLLEHAAADTAGILDEPAVGILESADDLSRLLAVAGDAIPRPDEFPPGFERFRVLRKVGSGGMGTVFEVFDTRLGTRLAAKTLRNVTGSGISLFKGEFRGLANIHHHNLVVLHEFHAGDTAWFYTMEFVDGAGLMACLDRPRGEVLAEPGRIALIRNLLGQLFDGIAAIHAAGKLHRDIKPGNILVTPEGRLVLLDFGLVTDARIAEAALAPVGGTAAWMSPEQLRGKALTEASDWYSAGVVLYEMLTGRLPAPAAARLRNDGSSESQVVPTSVFADFPGDLAALCLDLLALKPEDRPRRAEIARRLGRIAPAVRVSGVPRLLGRESELSVLDSAYERAGDGHGVAVLIEGQSGIGKSALINHFLDDFAADQSTIVLRGRCYERESVPFNALDSVIDDLCRRLRGLPPEQLEPLIPADIAALCEMFPALGWLLRPGWRRVRFADRLQVQRHAFHAFRELLTKLARIRRVIVFIDDLHWGDADSALMLNELLREPGAPGLLLILAHRLEPGRLEPARLEPGAENRCMKTLLAEAPSTLLARRVELGLQPLSVESASKLAEIQLPEGADQAWSAAIARESHGIPFFIEEMAAYAAGSQASAAEKLSLNAVLSGRAAQLPEPALRLLEIVALSGQPVRDGDAIEAAQIGEAGPGLLSRLRAGHFVRAATPSASEFLEPFHNRVRESVLAAIPAARRKNGHARLAVTLERSGRSAPETLAIHFEGAGEAVRAGSYFETAGRGAVAALAFDHAARMFERALALSEYEPERWRAVMRDRAEALANAGKAFDAAKAYAEASDGASHEGAICLSRSGYHYAASGHIEDARKAFGQALGQLGLKHSLTPSVPVLRLLAVRALNARKRLRAEPRTGAAASPLDLARIDALWHVGSGLGLVALTTGALFTSLSLRLALRTADRFRIVRGLAWEAAIEASQSRKGKRSAQQIFAVCREHVRHIDDPYAPAMLALTEGQACFSHGQWTDALRNFERAEELFTAHCRGVSFELTILRAFRLQTLVYRGDYNTLRATIGGLLEDVRSSHDRRGETFIQGAIAPLLLLASDRPDAARDLIRTALEASPARAYDLQNALIAQVKIAVELYAGDGEAAAAVIRREWPRINRAGLLFNQNLRAKLVEARGRCALAQCAGAGDPEKLAAQLAGEQEPYMEGSVLAIRAGADRARGGKHAERLLEESAAAFADWGMNDHAASVRYTLAEWRGAQPGEDAISWFTGQKIENPQRWARMRLPYGGGKRL